MCRYLDADSNNNVKDIALGLIQDPKLMGFQPNSHMVLSDRRFLSPSVTPQMEQKYRPKSKSICDSSLHPANEHTQHPTSATSYRRSTYQQHSQPLPLVNGGVGA
jgi:hypothetical protein